MPITVSAFERSPDRGRRLARDMVVRRALEEEGRPYAVRPVSFAALATLEPPMVERAMAVLVERDPLVHGAAAAAGRSIRQRLADLAHRPGGAPRLDGPFRAGHLMMVAALRPLAGAGLLAEQPALAAHVARGQGRPAFRRAFAARRAVFEAAAPDG